MKPTIRAGLALLGGTIIFVAFNISDDRWQIGLGLTASVLLSIAWIGGHELWASDGPEEEDEL